MMMDGLSIINRFCFSSLKKIKKPIRNLLALYRLIQPSNFGAKVRKGKKNNRRAF
jgi:hypothetical protein